MQTVTYGPPLYASRVSAGFPSPTDDYIDKRLDLNERLVLRPAATLFFWVRDDAMRPATLWPGDILIAGRSIKAHHNRIVLARVHGEALVRRLMIQDKTGRLVADNPDYPAIELKEGLDYRILGVVRYRIGELYKSISRLLSPSTTRQEARLFPDGVDVRNRRSPLIRVYR